MASKRMFSLRIINSARFLKMPISARLLYYDLGMRADDDGIVEAYTVIRYIGCTEDDLKVLVAKGFVQVLNEDLISYITDWNENNHIRPDRKIDSIYKDLLLKVLPDVPLIEKKERADVKKSDIGQAMDGQWTDNGPPMDNQRTAQVRLGKDRLGKSRLDKDSISCTERSRAAVPALILNTGEEWQPTTEDYEEWSKLYPNVDITNEFGRMRQWCMSNPSKRKTARGIRRFAQTWLDREQNKPRKGTTDKLSQKFDEMKDW